MTSLIEAVVGFLGVVSPSQDTMFLVDIGVIAIALFAAVVVVGIFLISLLK